MFYKASIYLIHDLSTRLNTLILIKSLRNRDLLYKLIIMLRNRALYKGIP